RRVDAREAEPLAGRFAVDRKIRGAVTRRGSERALADATLHLRERFGIVAQLGREAAGPQRNRARHRWLHVRVAGKRGVAFTGGEGTERRGGIENARSERLDGISQIQAQRREHLIVARASEMHSLARFADPRREQRLERRLSVLVLWRHAPLAACV